MTTSTMATGFDEETFHAFLPPEVPSQPQPTAFKDITNRRTVRSRECAAICSLENTGARETPLGESPEKDLGDLHVAMPRMQAGIPLYGGYVEERMVFAGFAAVPPAGGANLA